MIACMMQWNYVFEMKLCVFIYTKKKMPFFFFNNFMWVKVCQLFIQCKANKTEGRNGNSPNSHSRNLWHTHLEMSPLFRFILCVDNLALVWDSDWKLRIAYSCMSEIFWIKCCLSAISFDIDDSDNSLFEAQNWAFWKFSLILS